MPSDTVFGLEQRNLFLQPPRAVAQFHVLTGLNAEQHLADKVSQRLAETGGQFGTETGELGFQPRTNFAMFHRGRLQGRAGFFSRKTLLPPLPPPPPSPTPKITTFPS